MEKVALATFKRIECHAEIKLDLDMGNDTAPMKKMLKEGKDCVSHRVSWDSFALGDQLTGIAGSYGFLVEQSLSHRFTDLSAGV